MKPKNQNEKITNTHTDHVASCLCCANFRGDIGEPDISDATPGYPASIECQAGEFSFGAGDHFPEILVVIHDTARHCIFFTPISVVQE